MKDLYLKLKEAYSEKNLNKITADIIELYKTGQHSRIRDIASAIENFVDVDPSNISKCFSKLVMIYHPDKGAYYHNEIEKNFNTGNQEGLNRLSHILIIQDLKDVPVSRVIIEDIDYNPEYGVEDDLEPYGFHYSEKETDTFESEDEGFYPEDGTFFSALKRKLYGRVDIDLPTYYLEDLDEIDMSGYEIDSLDGVEYCIHTAIMDLSKNQITDISELWTLNKLEELYLSNNQIGYIDALSNLPKLRIIDISNNEIDDISPLFDLEYLEYINISGNNIPDGQAEYLASKDVIVIY